MFCKQNTIAASVLSVEHVSRPVIAGIVAALVGFTSSFAVVLAGLRAVGATPAQAASGLLVLSLAQGLGILWLTLRHRTPLILAWSTPGAAMLATTGAVAGGWSAAVGAFLLVGVLILITGLWPALGRLVAAIPTALAQAMLAGVVLVALPRAGPRAGGGAVGGRPDPGRLAAGDPVRARAGRCRSPSPSPWW